MAPYRCYQPVCGDNLPDSKGTLSTTIPHQAIAEANKQVPSLVFGLWWSLSLSTAMQLCLNFAMQSCHLPQIMDHWDILVSALQSSTQHCVLCGHIATEVLCKYFCIGCTAIFFVMRKSSLYMQVLLLWNLLSVKMFTFTLFSDLHWTVH